MISDAAYRELMARGRTINRFDAIDPNRTALLVIDLQNGFIVSDSPFGMARALPLLPMANRVAQALRAAGGKVVWTRHTYTDAGPQALAPWQAQNPVIAALAAALRPAESAHRLHADLEVEPQDAVIDKYRYSAFTHHSSDLHETLQAWNIDTLIIMGCVANCCCESTARDAYQMGYKVIFLADGNAAPTAEDEAAARLSVASVCADVRPAAEVLAMLA